MPPPFPPVRPLPGLVPWGVPGTFEQLPRDPATRPQAAIASGATVQARDAVSTKALHSYAQVNGSINIDVGAIPVLVLAAPQNYRNFLLVRNTGGNNVFLDFGREATTTSPIILFANTMMLLDIVVPQDDVYALCAAGTSTLSIGFGNINYLGSPTESVA
jgi:hypothetical protein